MANKIYFNPATQYENTGDILINKSLINVLKGYGTIVLDDTNKPDWFISELVDGSTDGVIMVSQLGSGKGLIKALLSRPFTAERKVTYYLVLHPGHTALMGSKKAFLRTKLFVKFFLLKLLGCRIIRLGFSIGPFDKLNSSIEALTSNCYSFYGLRDFASIRLAKSVGLKNPQYFPDWAWAYPRLNAQVSAEAHQTVIISFRSNTLGTGHQQDYLSPITQKLKELLEPEKEVLKIKIIFQVKYDREAGIDMYNALKSAGFNVEFVDKKLMVDEAQQLYANAKYVLSNRLHVLLLALQAGTPAFPFIIESDNGKITGIYTDNELNDLILYSNDDSAANQRKISQVFAKKDSIINHIKAIQDKNVAQQISILNKIFN